MTVRYASVADQLAVAAALCVAATTAAVGNADVAAAEYSNTTALRMVLHSDAAYCGDDVSNGSTQPIRAWRCQPCENEAFRGVKVDVVGVAQGGGRDAFAYVALQDDDVVVSFRGSVLELNFDDDFDFWLKPWAPAAAPGALVHEGVARSYDSIADQVTAHLATALGRAGPRAKVFITGHSLGAAQATLAAVDLPAKFPEHAFELYSFGALRVGNLEFVELFMRRHGGTAGLTTSWRVTHRRDLVPLIPPKQSGVLGFRHVPREVWYKDPDSGGPGSLDYVVCDGSGEDPRCIDSVGWGGTVDRDHNWYVGHAMWCCAGSVASKAECHFPFDDGPNRGQGRTARPDGGVTAA
eukprot:m.416890 g.416890  ORF g.416890 m.416890 type:complete len:352 (-) comp30158_c0_seq1:79-1134(-)